MTKSALQRTAGIALNVVLVITCAVTCADIVGQFLQRRAGQAQLSARAAKSDPGLPQGSLFPLSGQDWSKTHATVLLAIAPGCHFCTQSAPFYKKLLASVQSANIDVVALTQNPENATRSYLAGLGLSVPKVKQFTFSTAKIRGTPTLILVDGKGRVERTWVGALEPDGEKQVMEMIAGANVNKLSRAFPGSLLFPPAQTGQNNSGTSRNMELP